MIKNNKQGLKGVCPKCFEEKRLFPHALFPQRFFEKNNYFIYLCEECSGSLKNILSKNSKINETIYFKIQKSFIHLGYINIPTCLEKGQIGTKLKGVCPRCFQVRYLEKHHIFPLRFYEDSTEKLFLCHSCHKKIEKIIPIFYKLNKKLCLDLHKAFIRGLETPRKILNVLRREREFLFKKLSN